MGRTNSALFRGLDTWLVGCVHVDRNRQVAEMFFNQRLHLLPVEPSDACCQAGKRNAPDFLALDKLRKGFETVIDVLNRRLPRLGPMTGSWFLGKDSRFAPPAPAQAHSSPVFGVTVWQ